MNIQLGKLNKSWWQSRTVWGGLVAAGAGIAGVFDISLPPEEQDQIVDLVLALTSALGGLVAVVGRIKAERKIK